MILAQINNLKMGIPPAPRTFGTFGKEKFPRVAARRSQVAASPMSSVTAASFTERCPQSFGWHSKIPIILLIWSMIDHLDPFTLWL
jgi:hypothetical protein